MSRVNPHTSQPISDGTKRNNSEYVPAEWKPAGTGGGHPKISGGDTVSKTAGVVPTRSFNRPDQRYELSEALLQSRRNTRAAMEIDSCSILAGAAGLVEVRSSTGRNYDVNPVTQECDCPDFTRLIASGKVGVICKHIIMANTKIAGVAGYTNLNWATSRLAEVMGISQKAAQQLCLNGTITAGKDHGNWSIPPIRIVFNQIRTYTGKLISRKYMPQPGEGVYNAP